MKIAIIGAGAMGSLFGGHLSKVSDVCLYDINEKHVEAINNNGLLMTKNDIKTIVKPRATTNAKEIGIVDAVIFFTKYIYMDSAVKDALNCIDKNTIVVTLQNGIGSADIIKKYVDEEQIAYGLTAYTSDLKGPGHIEQTTLESVETYFWPLNGKVSKNARLLEAIMNKAGFETHITKDVNKKIWSKLMINCSENTLCALLHITVGQLINNLDSYEIVKQVVFEISDVARAKGIDISREEGLKYLDDVSKAVLHHLPSMALDVKNKNKTEIACLNEAVVAEGEKLGVPTPTTALIAKMIKTIEANYSNLAF